MPASKRDTEDLILFDLDMPHGGGVRLGTLVMIRWMGIAGQLLALIVVGGVLRFDLHLHLTLPIVLVSALINMWFSFRADKNTRLNDRQSAAHLAFDLIHLAALLFVTGGLANPFALLMISPTSVSASILGRGSTKYLIILSLVLVSALAFTPFPLPWNGTPPRIDPLLLAGLWIALCFTLVFLALYMARVGREGRHRARALAATQAALEHEQRLAALGTLAAAAAHELGTPLGTILLASKELLATWEGDDNTKTDLELIVQETSRCRDILAQLREHRQAGSADHFTHIELEALLREAAAPHEERGITIKFIADGIGLLKVRRSPEFIHAIRNIVENAVGYANSLVQVSAGWDEDTVSITIVDDGPGFDPQVIRRLGEPYVTTRHPTPGRDGGLGLGLFIAKTLLERTGAAVEFGMGSTGGAEILIEWPRDRLEFTPFEQRQDKKA